MPSIENDIMEIIDMWCPAPFSDEPLSSRLVRALMEANACACDQQVVIEGLEPMRPLSSYPIYHRVKT
jgi:hypothetical protein